MKTLIKKEVNMFLSTSIGYIIIGVFLIINSLLLWSDLSKLNILNYGYADMDVFFNISPLIFLFFIPAISMKIFAEEYTTGTYEILKTKPITEFQIVFSKFISVFILVLMSVLPTIIYLISIYLLKENGEDLDLASISGSYLGLFFLSSIFTSISIYASSLSNKQVVSFIIAIFLNYLFYFGFVEFSKLIIFKNIDLIIEQFGIAYHYNMMSKGLIKLSDIVYFISLTILFIKLTEIVLKGRKF